MSDAVTTIQSLKDEIKEFVRQRDWAQFHSPKNLAMSVAIEAAELMEHFHYLQQSGISNTKEDMTCPQKDKKLRSSPKLIYRI